MGIDAIATALGGMQRNQEAFARHAQRIALAGAPPADGGPVAPGGGPDAPGGGADGAEAGPGVDLAQEMVGLTTSRRGYEANLAVVRAADDMLGTLLDALA